MDILDNSNIGTTDRSIDICIASGIDRIEISCSK